MTLASFQRSAKGLALVLALLLSGGQSLAAISAAMVFEVANGGSDANNSGGFRGGAYIAAPSAPTVTPSGSGGTVAANTYYVVATYTDTLGDTVISSQTAVTTSGATASFTVTAPAAATGALTWNAYCGTTTGGPYFPQGTALVNGANRVVTTTPPTSGTQPRGVDYSLATGLQLAINNTTVTATTAGANSNVITFTGYTPTGADVGNMVRIYAGGTNITAGDYEITAVTTTTWTVAGAANLTTAGGAGSAITGGMGGCFASPGQAIAFAIASNTVYLKYNATPFTVANGTNNTAGNKFTTTNSQAIVGYATNRNPFNTDTAPVLDAGAASMTICTLSSSGPTIMHNLSFTNSAARAGIAGISASTTCRFDRISMTGLASSISGSGGAPNFSDCVFTSCGTPSVSTSGISWNRCVSITSVGNAWTSANSWTFTDCIAISPSGTGFLLSGGSGVVQNCVAYGAGQTGFQMNSPAISCVNCISYGNTNMGFLRSTQFGNVIRNCAAGGNGTDFDPAFTSIDKINCITLSGDPFVASGSSNFALNTTAGRGAACRAAGIPGAVFGLGTTTGYRDIGAVQHADPAGGGFRPRPRTSFNLAPQGERRKAG